MLIKKKIVSLIVFNHIKYQKFCVKNLYSVKTEFDSVCDGLYNKKDCDLEISKNLIEYLKSRNLIDTLSDEKIVKLSDKFQHKFKIYSGIDPTARSLHLGNLLPLIVLFHFYSRGHDIVVLIGEGTAKIGDPSGTNKKRKILEDDTIKDNVKIIKTQIINFFNKMISYVKNRKLSFSEYGTLEVMNNITWLNNIKLIDFISTHGKKIKIASMLNRTSLKKRLDSKESINLNEFLYQVIQAYDFFHLYKTQNVNMQIGGSDQWGNITLGLDFISKSKCKNQNKDIFALTIPLLTNKKNEKFGKSSGNALFIKKDLTSPFKLYQYILNTPDDQVFKYLKIFTFIPLSVLNNSIAPIHQKNPKSFFAQKILANEILDLVHGHGIGKQMHILSELIFKKKKSNSINLDNLDQLLHPLSNSGIFFNHELKDFEQMNEKKFFSFLSDISNFSIEKIIYLIKLGAVTYGLDNVILSLNNDSLFCIKKLLTNGNYLFLRLGKLNHFIIKFN